MTTNKDIINLFKGVGLIIDDAFDKRIKKQDKIWNIKSYFENKSFPILTYSTLPSDEKISHFRYISFVMLDWNLAGLPVGTIIPDELLQDNIEFIRKIKEQYFTPIFIFTNEDTDSVIRILTENNLYNQDVDTNHIFVKNKSDIKTSRTLFSILANWVKKTPSIYILKKWEKSISKATSTLFNDLYHTNPSWPYIMSKNYYDDIGGENGEICDLINRNLIARCSPLSLDNNIICKKRYGANKDDIRDLLECERFLKAEALQDYPIMGDVFKKGQDYFINIRPDCDIIRDDNPDLYCLKGYVINENKINKQGSRYVFRNGAFCEHIDFTIVPFIAGGKIIEFKFKHLKILKWNDIKHKRIGRLLPPYITRCKHQYIAFLQRQGVSSIPKIAIQ